MITKEQLASAFDDYDSKSKKGREEEITEYVNMCCDTLSTKGLLSNRSIDLMNRTVGGSDELKAAFVFGVMFGAKAIEIKGESTDE